MSQQQHDWRSARLTDSDAQNLAQALPLSSQHSMGLKTSPYILVTATVNVAARLTDSGRQFENMMAPLRWSYGHSTDLKTWKDIAEDWQNTLLSGHEIDESTSATAANASIPTLEHERAPTALDRWVSRRLIQSPLLGGAAEQADATATQRATPSRLQIANTKTEETLDYHLPHTSTSVLYFLLNRKDREAFLGDMQEEYRVAIERIGPAFAKVWYATQVLKEIVPVLWPRIKKLAGILGLTEAVRRWIGS